MFDATQGELDEDIDGVYSKTAASIAARKCKVFQKKKKLKLIITSGKKLINELDLSKKETRNIIKEKENHSRQEIVKLENIKGVKHTQTSVETQLCDLKNKITSGKNKNQEKMLMFKEALQEAEKTWESYEKQYNELPLAKKRHEISVEIKKINIEIKSTILNTKERKEKKELKDQIAEKRRHSWVVKLAKAHFEYQECIASRNVLRKEKLELIKLLEDIKAGKLEAVEQCRSQNSRTSRPVHFQERSNTKEVHQFKFPSFQISSPTSDSPEPPTKSRSSSWMDLLKSTNLFEFPKVTQKAPVESVKKTTESILTSKTVQNTRPVTYPNTKQATEFRSTNQNENHKKTGISDSTSKSSSSLNNSLSSVQNKFNDCMLNLKRKHDETTGLNKNETKEKIQTQNKPCSQIPHATHDSRGINKGAAKKLVMDTSENKQSNEHTLKLISNKKNHEVNESDPNNKSGINTYMPSFPKNSKNQHLTAENFIQNILSANQQKVKMQTLESQKNASEKSLQSLNNHPVSNLKVQADDQQNKDAEDSFLGNETQLDNSGIMSMDPNSPPDVIPENRSQPLLQTNTIQNASDKQLSQTLSDFTSPLDEAARLHYQQIAAESPGFVCPINPEFPISSNQREAIKPTVNSHYFSNLSPEMPPMQECEPPVFSPSSNMQLNDESNQLNVLSPPPGNLGSVFSPPAGNLGGFGFEMSHSAFDRSSKKDNKANDAFNFSFNSTNNNKNPTSSFFFTF